MKLISIIFTCLFTAILGLFTISPNAFAQVNVANGTQINTNLTTRVAPGELLPVSIKLSNFGAGKRVDVVIKYSILTNTDTEVYSTSETVAVETTASFIKHVQIPSSVEPGTYIAKTSLVYQGQLAPATTQFSFTVERKILGIFQSDFLFYGSIAVIAGIALTFLGRFLVKHLRATRLTPLDYHDIPKNERIFYEILSDTIMQMRGHVGIDALLIAANIDGLKIDERTGRVLGFTKSPSKVIANLVSEYEEQLGKKVSFSLRREKIE